MAVTEDFYYVEGNTSVKNLVKTLVTEITQNAGIYKWDLVVPDSIDKIGITTQQQIDLITDGSVADGIQTIFTVDRPDDTCILKATTSYGKTFYIKIWRDIKDISIEEFQALSNFKSLHNVIGGTRTDAQVLEIMAGKIAINGEYHDPSEYNNYVSAMNGGLSLNCIKIKIAKELNSDGTDIDISTEIQQRYNHRLAWYKALSPEIKDFLPVQYWLNITKDSINLVLRGDPSADVAPYNNYLTSYCYIGALKPVEDSAYTDDEYNFGITTGSDIEPDYVTYYGVRTATGVTDVCMIANKVGMPYQPHYPAFYTTNPFMDKCNVEGSRWDHKKHQFSDITLVHPVDMERGKMINVLVGDASSIYDADKLVYLRDTDQEESYKKFKITAPFNFLNNSANINYCLAIRCYKASE
ncbi:hypothetical protein [Clostridium tyrobutyricum]|uniref:hypothetical protein n=1 Tax=Clostridium tyrobutyricum TaxID=1519 RepID=UPI0010AB4DD8|nr:hypothetical protein [Clostridium tyrobutyricum]QCH28453.1 hypothetical protein EZN00_02057 [Clostridium tyrobutyricum]